MRSEEWDGDPMGFMDLSRSIEDDIAAGMKMFDIKPDYYVDDNYLSYSYDEDSDDEIYEEFEDDDEEDWEDAELKGISAQVGAKPESTDAKS